MAEWVPSPDEGQSIPPSALAARRARAVGRRRGDHRAYPPPVPPRDPESLAVELEASRALLRAESPSEVAAVVATLVHDLGGALVPARYADPAAVLPVDVSLGLSEPLLPYADPVSVAMMRLTRVLPQFLEAARVVLARLPREHALEATDPRGCRRP